MKPSDSARANPLAPVAFAAAAALAADSARRVFAPRAHRPVSRVSVTTLIDAPPSEVWRDLRNIASHAAWMEDAVAIRFTSERHHGVGTTFEADTKVGPFRLTDSMEITEWEEGKCMGIRHGGVVTGTGRFALEPAGGDRTRFTWDEELTFPWWMGGLLGSTVAGQVLWLVWRRNLANLKGRIETATP